MRRKWGIPVAGLFAALVIALVAGTGSAGAMVGLTDLSLTKADTADPVSVGDTFGYVITVKNQGTNDAGDVIVTDTLPNEVNYVSTTPSQLATGKTTCDKAGSKITCDLGQVNAGATATVTITVQAKSSGTASDTASLTSADDTNAANNLDSETTTINKKPTTPTAPKTKHKKRGRLSCATPTIVGTPGDDVLYGTSGADAIVGLSGNDKIYGGGGKDVICAGSGRDLVYGNSGGDVLKGKGGPDRLAGGSGNDFLSGGKGRDRCKGGSGHDTLRSC
jgi:uncharacterized repeat protein (TIGR01451 family)